MEILVLHTLTTSPAILYILSVFFSIIIKDKFNLNMSESIIILQAALQG